MDYTLEDTIYHTFTTRAFATGIPTVLAGTPVVSAYENDSVTQITAGITLGVSHDGVVGLNLLTIVATAANGFEAGKDYNLVITTGTVGGVSVVGESVWHFSLGRSAAAADLANATDGLSALKTLIDTLDNFVDTEIADIQSRIPAVLVGGRMDASVGAMAANTLTAAATAADFGTEIADAVWDEVMVGTTTARQTQMIAQAALAGLASGLGTTTAVYKNIAGDADAITATVDASGNRTAVTLVYL